MEWSSKKKRSRETRYNSRWRPQWTCKPPWWRRTTRTSGTWKHSSPCSSKTSRHLLDLLSHKKSTPSSTPCPAVSKKTLVNFETISRSSRRTLSKQSSERKRKRWLISKSCWRWRRRRLTNCRRGLGRTTVRTVARTTPSRISLKASRFLGAKCRTSKSTMSRMQISFS